MLKKINLLTLICMILFRCPMAATQFTDITENHSWAIDAISEYADYGIINGVSEETFDPDGPLTREQFAVVLVKTFNAKPIIPNDPTFEDVPSDRYSYGYVEACKEILSGYSNPFGGKPSFKPTDPAVREDMAVAIVKMIGLNPENVKDVDSAREAFTDGESISGSLLVYVSIAYEQGLISGSDGKFRPKDQITRAEAVTMLDNALKQAAPGSSTPMTLDAKVIAENDPSEITLSIKTDSGAKVYIDGDLMPADASSGGYQVSTKEIKLDNEGNYSYDITAVRLVQSKSVVLEYEYAIGAPTLTIGNLPDSTTLSKITVNGSIKDYKDEQPTLMINGELIEITDGNWKYDAQLEPGDNTFTFVAQNNLDKTSTIERVVKCVPNGPVVEFSKLDESTNKLNGTISGKVTDENDENPTISVNGTDIEVSEDGKWSIDLEFEEGSNELEFIATNNLGVTTVVSKVVKANPDSPVINPSTFPEKVTKASQRISGTAKDAANNKITFTINGEELSLTAGGAWAMKLELEMGVNEFHLVARNDLGKVTELDKTIIFEPNAPTIKFTKQPTSSPGTTAAFVGSVKDPVDSSPIFTINGEPVELSRSGGFNVTLDLDEGVNKFVFKAVNKYGISTIEEKSCSLNIGTPEIVFTSCPEYSDKKDITIKGRVEDANKKSVRLFMNNSAIKLTNSGVFSVKISLDTQASVNQIAFYAVNQFGRSTSVVKRITFTEYLPPVIGFDQISMQTSESRITVSGTVTDKYDKNVQVYVNDIPLTVKNGKWSTTVDLKMGLNDIVAFAINQFGRNDTDIITIERTN